jgi:hypothetical protein
MAAVRGDVVSVAATGAFWNRDADTLPVSAETASSSGDDIRRRVRVHRLPRLQIDVDPVPRHLITFLRRR